MSKLYREKKVYPKFYNDVFRACELALAKLKCSIKEAKGNYFHIRIGFLPCLFGYIIEFYLMELSDKQIEVRIYSKAGFLLLFCYPERIVKEIFKKIDQSLDFQE